MISTYIRRKAIAVPSGPIRRALLLWLLFCATGTASAADITLATNTGHSQEGYFVLSWHTLDPAGTTLTLQQARTPDFEQFSELIVPASGAHTITGLADGEYWFRAGSAAEGWSDAVSVNVAHHSLLQAMAFFTLGLLLFLILCGVILRGAHNTYGEAE